MNAREMDRAIRSIIKMGFHPFEQDGRLHVSAEHGDDAADYYGEFRGGYAWINPKLEAFAEKRGCYWEWCNPGCLILTD
jgi:hypothetical protein